LYTEKYKDGNGEMNEPVTEAKAVELSSSKRNSKLRRGIRYLRENWTTLPLSILGFGTDVVTVAAARANATILHTLGFVTLAELAQRCQENPAHYLVEGLIPADDVHVAVGDSGLGKTAWAYQLGLCVASGTPFLGHAVRKARVLYYDLENGLNDVVKVDENLRSHLGIPERHPDFLVFPNDGEVPRIESAATCNKHGLILIDSLRSLNPDVESDNARMGRFLEKLRTVAREHHCAILLLYHIRKTRDSDAPKSKFLEDTPTLDWLLQASDARALINQTNARIAFAKPKYTDAAFVMNSFVKMKGETGLVYLQRAYNDSGEPIGYRRIVGPELLGNSAQEDAFRKLPDPPQQFTFSEAKHIYGRSDNPTSQFLKKCEGAGLVRRVDRGIYEKAAWDAKTRDVGNCLICTPSVIH
jgi:AAA domain